MSRAIRRQQQQAANTKEKPPRTLRGLGLRRSPQRGQRPPVTQQKRGIRLGVPRWLEEIISELKKVTWPTRQETFYLATVVIVVSLAAGLALGGVDIFFNWLIDRLLLR
jgi:preprotein translocase subunit SecE